MSKHTPGPWEIGIETDEELAQIITSDGWHLATVEHDPVLANAKAISAVPELIEACSLALADFELEGIDLNKDTVDALRLALNKIK